MKKFGRLNFNFLRVFRTGYRERNVMKAVKQLKPSRSAVSHSHRHLRDAIGGELFLRTDGG